MAGLYRWISRSKPCCSARWTHSCSVSGAAAGAGTAGRLVGGTAVWALTGRERPASRLAATREERRRFDMAERTAGQGGWSTGRRRGQMILRHTYEVVVEGGSNPFAGPVAGSGRRPALGR